MDEQIEKTGSRLWLFSMSLFSRHSHAINSQLSFALFSCWQSVAIMGERSLGDDRPNGLSQFLAVIFVMGAVAGIGVLALPHAMTQTGGSSNSYDGTCKSPSRSRTAVENCFALHRPSAMLQGRTNPVPIFPQISRQACHP